MNSVSQVMAPICRIMPRDWTCLALWVVVMVPFWGVSAPAVAQVDADDMEALEEHLQRGRAHLDDQSFQAAIEELEQARNILDHPLISLNIAGALQKLGRCSEAESEYAILSDREDLDDEMTEELAADLESLDQCVERVMLEIICDPEEAQIALETSEGERLVDCPYAERTAVGEVTVSIVDAERRGDRQQLQLEPGRDRRLELVLPPDDAQEPEEPKEPVSTVDSAPEETQTQISERDSAVPDEVADDQVQPPRWPTVLSYSSIGIGLAMITGGAVIDYGARSRTAALIEAREAGDIQRFERLESEGSDRRLMAALLYGGGVALVAGGLALQWVDLSSSSQGEESFQMVLSPAGISALIHW